MYVVVIVVHRNSFIWMEFYVGPQDKKGEREGALVQGWIGRELYFSNYKVQTGQL